MSKKGIILTFISCALILVACGSSNNDSSNLSIEEVSLAPAVEVLSPATEVTTVDDSNSIGAIAWYPNSADESLYALAGTNCVTFYFKKSGVTTGNGYIGLGESGASNLLEGFKASDNSRLVVSTMDDIGKDYTGWDSGTMIDVYFDTTFEAGKQYYIILDSDCFEKGEIVSNAVDNSSIITFYTKGYGISGDIPTEVEVGESITFTALMDDTVSMVYLKGYDDSYISVSEENLSETGTFTLSFTQEGEASITISFLSDGNEIDSISYTFNVVTPDNIEVNTIVTD